MAPHSSTLAWKIPGTERPDRLWSMGSLRVRHDWKTSLSLFTFMHWRRKWQPTPVFLPGESQGQRSLVGSHLWGYTVGHNWNDLAAAAAAAAEYTVEFTFGVLSSGNKIDICLHKNLPQQFAMQKLSANLNTVFKTRNQLFGYGEDGLYHVVKLAWQLPYFLWRQNNLFTS